MSAGKVLTQRSREAEGGTRSVASVASAVPPLRFKGFTGAWEEKKLGKVFDFSTATNTLSRAELKDVGTIRNVHYGDVLIKLPSVTDINVDELPCVADSRFKVSAKNRLQDGDIIMADTAEDEAVGKVTEIQGVGENDVVSGLHTIVMRPRQIFGAGYLGYSLNAHTFHDELFSIMQGVKVLSINKSALSDVKMRYPDAPEQRKIGAAFREIDALIATREEALDKLAKLKKAMLEKMFPQRGSRVPELRFKGFEGDWEEVPFDAAFERLQAKDCQIQSGEYLEIGKYPVVDQGKVVVIAYSDRADKVFRAEGNPVIVFGDHTREIKFVDFDFVIGADGTQLLRTNGQDISFGFYALTRIRLPNMGYSRHFKYLLESHISIPSLPEQRKIGAYFRSLDALLVARREEIGKLKDLKKALLDRMFV